MQGTFEPHLGVRLYPFEITVYCSPAMTIPGNVRLQIRYEKGICTSAPKAASVLAYFFCIESELVEIVCVAVSHRKVPVEICCCRFSKISSNNRATAQ